MSGPLFSHFQARHGSMTEVEFLHWKIRRIQEEYQAQIQPCIDRLVHIESMSTVLNYPPILAGSAERSRIMALIGTTGQEPTAHEEIDV